MTNQTLMNTYGTRAATLVKGAGARLWDAEGNEYLDALSGIAVCGLGHSHPAVAKAVAEQATTLTHCSNFFTIPNQENWPTSYVPPRVWIKYFLAIPALKPMKPP